jgi:hypothetical protein
MDEAAAEVMTRLGRTYEQVWRQIEAANADFGERLRQYGVLVYYDPDDDTLIMRLDVDRPTMTETRDDLLWVHVDPQSYQLLGVEITGVQAFLAAHPEALPSTERLLANARQAPGTFVHVPLVDAEAVRELIPA